MATITRPDFSKIPLDQAPHSRQWEKAAVCWMTHEQIPIKSYYAAEDLAGLEHLDYAAGIPPFLRGPYSTMLCPGLGQSVSTRDSQRRRSQTRSIDAIWRPVRRVFLWPSTCPRTGI